MKCEHCKTPLKNWDGMIVKDKIDNNLNALCTPCLMVINKEYDGKERFDRVTDLPEVFYNTNKAEKELKKIANNNETKEKVTEWFKIVNEQKNELDFGVEEGPSDFWKHFGYSSEDDYYFDHFGESKKEYFEKRALEILNYQKYFELIIYLAKQTNGRDHRFYLIASKYEINSLIMKWFDEMKLSKRKVGYMPFIEFVRESIDNIWKGRLTVEDSLYLVRLEYIKYLQSYENIQLELHTFEQNDRNIKIKRTNKEWK